MVSHELRTPLAAVRGSVTTLLESAGDLAPAEMTQFLRIILDQSDQARLLISDLLDVAHIETGALVMEPEPVDINVLVEEASSRLPSGGARHPLHVDLADDPPMVMADRRHVVQVLGNLLSNAAGYSHASLPIVVSARRDGVHMAVCVADQGRAIPSEMLPELFRVGQIAAGAVGHVAGVRDCPSPRSAIPHRPGREARTIAKSVFNRSG